MTWGAFRLIWNRKLPPRLFAPRAADCGPRAICFSPIQARVSLVDRPPQKEYYLCSEPNRGPGDALGQRVGKSSFRRGSLVPTVFSVGAGGA